MIVYQALYGEHRVFCRPRDMSMSEVDKEKYPNAKQKYRLEKIENTEFLEKLKAIL